LYGYNYQIILKNCHCFPKPSARKTPLAGGKHSWLSGPTGPLPPSACPVTEPAWRMAAVAQDGLCLEMATQAQHEGSGEKMFFSYRNFAASRLRVNPRSRPARPPVPWHDRFSGKQARLDDGAATPDSPADVLRPRTAAGTRAPTATTFKKVRCS